MDLRREDAELQNYHINSSFIPETPAKPGSTNQQPIYTGILETHRVNSVNSVILPESGTLTEDLLQGFGGWQTGANANSFVHENHWHFPSNETNQLASLSFGNLLALAESKANPSAIENVLAHHNFVACSRSNSFCPPQIETQQNQSNLFGTNFVCSETSAPWLFYNDSQFDPITLMKSNQGESAVKDLSVGELPANKEKEDAINGVIGLHKEGIQARETQLQEKPSAEVADLSKTPQQKSRRKKHRPKVIIEGQNKRTPKPRGEKSSVTPKSTTEKRKYVRRNKASSPGVQNQAPTLAETPTKAAKSMEEGTSEVHIRRYPQRSCRRSLNFNLYDHVEDESSLFCVSPNGNREVQAENLSGEVISDQEGQVKEGCFSQNPSFPNHIVSNRGKCQIVFSDVVTHDKQVNTVQNAERYFNTKSPIDSISTSLCLTPEKQEKSLKRRSINMEIKAELCNRNETEIFYHQLQPYAAYHHTILPTENINRPPGLHFPTIYKKKRTEKSLLSSSLQMTASTSNDHGNSLKYFSCTKLSMSPANHSVIQVDNLLTTRRPSDDNKNGRQLFEDLLGIGHPQRITKRRSRGPTRRRDLASLLEDPLAFPGNTAKYCKIGKGSAIPHGPHTCMEALVADSCSTMIKRKRSKRSTVVGSTVQSFYYHQNFASASTGPQLALTWNSMSLIDIIIEKLRRLDLNAQSNQDLEGGHRALVAYNGYHLDQPVVQYQQSRAIVPFNDQVRRRRPRPKVNLDDETNRVWKLLLENINNEGVDGTDEEKAKWWEEERRVFRGRADSFIARMHLVQGDRRFSPWKGSVVDSVVGVFLTQNVSDHLSSSAFMSMASRYALRPESFPEELDGENFGRKTNEPEVCELDSDTALVPNKEILNHSVCDEDAKNGEKSIILLEDERDSEDTLSSQNSTNSPVAATTERTESYLPSSSGEESLVGFKPNQVTNSACFAKLMQMTESVLQKASNDNRQAESESKSASSSQSTLCHALNSGAQATTSQSGNKFCATEIWELSSESVCGTTFQKTTTDATGSTSNIDNSKGSEHKEVNSNKNSLHNHSSKMITETKGKAKAKKEKEQIDWDYLRKDVRTSGKERTRTKNTMDSVDWDAVRCADVNEIADTIKERGMNNMLAERIKAFLNRIVRDHGSIDLEWLRDVPPDKAKEYLLSIRGLGLKSVECVRLLTLHHLAFPVDTNVGRIAVRLGWVPLQPLPESLQLHLLELYPVLESIQKFLWPRLCKLDQKTLYELHYQMITFGKVFCTKNKPNCNACPMRGECRHFASAFASARLSLPAPQEKSIVSATENRRADLDPIRTMNALQLPSTQTNEICGISNYLPIIEEPPSPEPIIEVPATPERDDTHVLECDVENAFGEDPDEIPTIQLNMEEFTQNLQSFMHQNTELQEVDMSKALVELTSAAASISMPKLKNMSRLRTEHQVYELPDTHPLLQGMDKREPDDPSPYLLAIWTPGETVDSIEPPERRCSSQGIDKLCLDETCSSCNSIRETNSQTVRGTILIPCRTAMRGSFPLNGTYFQVNEVFSDHESSLSPIDVPRVWLWNLPRRTVYFGTSIPTIFKGLSTEGIQYCFWRGFVCVRGFDRITRAPRPLIARLHFPASKLAKGKGKVDENA